MSKQIYKAQSIGNHTPPDLSLTATAELPDNDIPLGSSNDADQDWYAKHHAVFDEQAEIIFSALKASLPGGTIDALLIRLLEHRRSVFTVSYASATEFAE